MWGTKDDRHSNEYITLREVDPLDPSPSFCRLSAGPISSALMERPEDWVARARVSVCVSFFILASARPCAASRQRDQGQVNSAFWIPWSAKRLSLDYILERFFLVFWWHPASTREPTRPTEFCILGRELKAFQMLIHTYSAMVSSGKI